MNYFIVMIDYGQRGRQAIVDPEITRREVVSRIVKGDYLNVAFIHYVNLNPLLGLRIIEDVTSEILAEAAALIVPERPDAQAWVFDHAREYRKENV